MTLDEGKPHQREGPVLRNQTSAGVVQEADGSNSRYKCTGTSS